MSLLEQIKPIRDTGKDTGELAVLDEALKLVPEYIHPGALLEYNHWHKKGGLVIRSAQQFMDAVRGQDGGYHLLNEYWNHDPHNCPTCKGHGLKYSASELWASKMNRDADNALREAEHAREKALESYNFASLNDEERTQFKALRGDGWETNAINYKVESGTWQRKHANAAIRQQLKVGIPVSFEAFSYLVDEIKTLDTPVLDQQ